jgi:transcriptional regulator with XRE-family HTH domain
MELIMWHEFVKEVRASKKISQRALAREAAIDRNTLRRLEDGDPSIGLTSLEKVLSVLGYELDAIMVKDIPVRSKIGAKKLIGLRLPREV